FRARGAVRAVGFHRLGMEALPKWQDCPRCGPSPSPPRRCQDRPTGAQSRRVERPAGRFGSLDRRIDRATIQAIGLFGGLFFYGYQWWLGRTLSGEKEVTWVAGVGMGGQRLFIVPDLDLIVMTTSGAYASPRQGNAALEVLYRFVIPAVKK